MAYINSIYNAGNDYPQFLTKIVRISPSPIYTVNIVIDINGTKIAITSSGETSKIVKYKLTFKSNNTIIKTVYIQPNTEEYDLTSDGKGLGVQFYNLTIMAYDENGNVIGISESEEWYNIVPLPECEPMTLRFRFSKTDYSPVDEDAGTPVTTKGTWVKVESGSNTENLWDWTYDNPDWSNTFESVFINENNIVDIIQAGDTSNVTSLKSMFYGEPRTYLNSICLFDTSNVTTMQSMFYNCQVLTKVATFNTENVSNMMYLFVYCYALQKAPDFNTEKVTNMNGMYYECHAITTVPLYNTAKVTNMGLMFTNCINLTEVPLFDMSSVTDANNFLCGCSKLEHIPCFDISSCKNLKQFIGMCTNLKEIPNFNTASATSMKYMLNALTSVTSIPKLDYSNVTDLYMFAGVNNPDLAPQRMESLPDMSTITSKLTTCEGAFKNIRNVKYNILNTYNILKECNPKTTTDCFYNCGIDTQEGKEQLLQIPATWGGLKAFEIIDNPDGTKSFIMYDKYKGDEKINIPTEIQVNHVEFNRKFIKGAISTVVVPVDVNTEDNPDFTFYSNFYIKVIHNEETGEDEDNLAFVKVSGIIPRNTPMAIISNIDDGVLTWPDGEYIISTEPNRDIVSTMPQTGDKVSFKAVYEYTVYTEEMLNQGHTYYGFAGSSSTTPAGDIDTGDFVRVGAGAWMPPFRMVIDIEKKE